MDSVQYTQMNNKNKDQEIQNMIHELNSLNFNYPQLPNQPEQWQRNEANEVRELREQQERNWWLDKQYEWMKKHGSTEDPESLLLHVENGEELKKCKIESETDRSSNPVEAILIITFFVLLFFSS